MHPFMLDHIDRWLSRSHGAAVPAAAGTMSTYIETSTTTQSSRRLTHSSLDRSNDKKRPQLTRFVVSPHIHLFTCQRAASGSALRPHKRQESGNGGLTQFPVSCPRFRPSISWSRPGSNRQPLACKASALPIELRPRHSCNRPPPNASRFASPTP